MTFTFIRLCSLQKNVERFFMDGPIREHQQPVSSARVTGRARMFPSLLAHRSMFADVLQQHVSSPSTGRSLVRQRRSVESRDVRVRPVDESQRFDRVDQRTSCELSVRFSSSLQQASVDLVTVVSDDQPNEIAMVVLIRLRKSKHRKQTITRLSFRYSS